MKKILLVILLFFTGCQTKPLDRKIEFIHTDVGVSVIDLEHP